MSDQALLEEIRENFDTYLREWKDIRDEGDLDMKFLADGPWTEKEKKEREAADRPCLTFDELGQYTSQTVGDFRQNKRAIKVTPKGNGATDESAEKRSGMIRDMEYRSEAPVAYETAFDNMIKRSMGAWKLGTEYCTPDGAEQQLVITPISNMASLLVDPFAKKVDWSDMEGAFIIDSFSGKAFEKRWPDAEIKSFAGEEMLIAPAWVLNDRIQVAEYWRLTKTSKRKLWLDTGGADKPTAVFLDDLPKGTRVHDSAVHITIEGKTRSVPILTDRKTETPLVTQYITNGLEILERNPTKWPEIPIILIFGPEEWVEEGSGSRKRLLSMIRKARDAYKSYCYARTNEVEVLGMVPKVLYLGYEGQFATNTKWGDVNKVAMPYGEVKAKTTATGQEVLPLPTRTLYDPPVQGMEMAAASFRLSIQSAMGIGNGMVNGKGGQNFDAKSGKAIDALDRQEAQGTFVYIANFERGLNRCGRLAEGALSWVHDMPSEVGSRAPDDTYSTLKINQPVTDAEGNTTQFNTADGDHGTTISVGPSENSTRDAADDFVNTLIGMKGVPPKILALAVRLKNLGPIGDEIAKAFDPGDNGQPTPQQMQALQAELQKAHALGQSLLEKIETKQPELDVRLKIAEMQEETKRLLGLATIDAQQARQKLDSVLGIITDKLDRVHEASMQAGAAQNAKNLQDGGAQNDRALQDSGAANDAAAQASDQSADAASQDSAQTHQADQATQSQQAAADSQQSAQDATAEQQDDTA